MALEKDYEMVISKIDENKEFLNSVSRDIWKTPELSYREVRAHALLTCALGRHGFCVEKHYFMPTAFRAEFASPTGEGATVALLLEYDALPEIGHACGHNLIAEAGLAAALGVKAAMENDPSIAGKLAVLGTPAEESGGGKIKLIEFGALDGVDAALMVHPAPRTHLFPTFMSCVKGSVYFRGKEAHAAAMPWEGVNALDAAVACYQNIAMLRQQIKPTCRINVIITKSGSAVNVIPSESNMEFLIRAPSSGELEKLLLKVKACISSAAEATSCDVTSNFLVEDRYENLITNKILMNSFKSYLERLGFQYSDESGSPVGSTDMGNVSHIVPSIHPLYSILTDAVNHTKEFAVASEARTAQAPTLTMAKALALTTLHIMRCPDTLEAARKQLLLDVDEER